MKIKDFEWWIVAGLGLTAFFLALFGYEALFLEAGIERNLLDLTFHSVKLFAGEFVGDFSSPLPWQLEIARWLAPAVSLYAAFQALLFFIRREFKGQLLRFYRDHIVVVGLNEKSRYLIRDLLEKGKKVIVVAKVPDPRKLDELENLGAVIEEGSMADFKFLRRISAQKARYFVLLSDEDETNIARAISLYQYLTQQEKQPGASTQIIHTHVADDIKLNELTELNFFEEFQQRAKPNANCEIRIFSMYERTARVLFNQYAPDVFVPVRTNSPQTSVAVFGSGDLAQSMVVRIARLAHFSNLKKVRVVLFHEGNALVKKLTQNFSGLTSILDLEPVEQPLEFFDIDNFNALHQEKAFSAVYLLCEDDSLSSNLLKKLIHTRPSSRLKVVLGLQDPGGILSKWYNAELIDNLNLHKFNLIVETFSEDALISEHLDELAQTIHAVYLSGLKERNPEKATHRDWKFLPPGARGQNRDQADHLYVKLRALGCEAVKGEGGKEAFSLQDRPEMVEILSEMEHNRWWANKLLSGWVYGKTENGKERQHPDLVPYEELDEPTKDWDRSAVRNMPDLLAKGGYFIRCHPS